MYYAFDKTTKEVLRFKTEYQRDLFLKEDDENRVYLDKSHYLVHRVTEWAWVERGYWKASK